MACSRLGSRVLEAVWNSSSVGQRQSIAQELGNNDKHSLSESHFSCDSLPYSWLLFLSLLPFSVPSENQLRADQFARHVWAKFALSHFAHRRAHWQEIQTGESKKRKLFSDILEWQVHICEELFCCDFLFDVNKKKKSENICVCAELKFSFTQCMLWIVWISLTCRGHCRNMYHFRLHPMDEVFS